MTKLVAVTCPYCQNSDASLLERTSAKVGYLTVTIMMICHNCSKTFELKYTREEK